jgi:hypothetical protein
MKINVINDMHDYANLIEKISLIDMEAANYMIYKAPYLKNFCYSFYLSCCFNWERTPQGFLYWSDIQDKIGQKFNVNYKL